jgi:hypothetical protein
MNSKLFITLCIFILSACTYNPASINDPGLKYVTPHSSVSLLKKYDSAQLQNYFSTLSAPSFRNFTGPFKGTTLGNEKFLTALRNTIITFNPFTGDWEGKIFFSTSSTKGFGYNMFGKQTRRLKIGFNTSMAASVFDNKPVLRMDYASYPNILGLVDAFDEIRQIDSNNFLLIAHTMSPLLKYNLPMYIHLQRIK